MKMRWIRQAVLCTAFLLPATAIGQPEPPKPWTFTFEGGGLHQSETDMNDVDGAFSVDRWFLSAGVNYNFDFRTAIGVTIGAGNSDYEFDDLSDEDIAAPWDTIEDRRLAITSRFGFGERGTVLIIPTVRYNMEKGADSGDSQIWGLLAAAAWRLSPDLTIGPGIGVFSRLEDSTRVFPILAIDWNITERWNLATGRGLAASQGPGLTLSYKLTQAWSLGLTGRYEDVDFRLNDEGPAPGGIGRDRSLPLVLSAELNPDDQFRFAFFVGAEFGGELELQDPDGNEISKTEYDTAPILGATFELKF